MAWSSPTRWASPAPWGEPTTVLARGYARGVGVVRALARVAKPRKRPKGRRR